MTGILFVARLACAEIVGVAGGASERQRPVGRTTAGALVGCLVLGLLIASAFAELPLTQQDGLAIVPRIWSVLAATGGLLVLYLLGVTRLTRLGAAVRPLPAGLAFRATAQGFGLILVSVAMTLMSAPALLLTLSRDLGLPVPDAISLMGGAFAAGALGGAMVHLGVGLMLRRRFRAWQRLLAWITWGLLAAVVVDGMWDLRQTTVTGALLSPPVAAALLIAALLAVPSATALSSQDGSHERALLLLPEWKARAPLPLLTLQVRQCLRSKALRGVVLHCSLLTGGALLVLSLLEDDMRLSAAAIAAVLLPVCWTHPVLMVERSAPRTPAASLLVEPQHWRRRAYAIAIAISAAGAGASAYVLDRVAPGLAIGTDTMLLWAAAVGCSSLAGYKIRRSSNDAVDTAALSVVYLAVQTVAVSAGSIAGGQAHLVPALLAAAGAALLWLVLSSDPHAERYRLAPIRFG